MLFANRFSLDSHFATLASAVANCNTIRASLPNTYSAGMERENKKAQQHNVAPPLIGKSSVF